MTDVSRSPGKRGEGYTPLGSTIKDNASRKGPISNSVNTAAGVEPKKKTINFGERSGHADHHGSSKGHHIAKDAPTIGNPLMMKMEF